jgi:hypothetical protein
MTEGNGPEQRHERQEAVAITPPDSQPEVEFGFPLTVLADRAVAHPRDERKAEQVILRELEADPGLAEKHYYSIPYKKGDEGVVRVEGLSIRAAEAVMRRWGNLVAQSTIAYEDTDKAIMRGIAVDLETMALQSVDLPVRRKTKYRGRVRVLDDDKWDQRQKATASKALRNAILRLIPMGMSNRYFTMARRLAATGTDESAAALKRGIDGVVKAVALAGRTRADLEQIVGKPIDEWTRDDLGHLKGTLNAIADRETTWEHVLGKVVATPEEQETAAGKRAEPEQPIAPPTANTTNDEAKPETATAQAVEGEPTPEELKAHDLLEAFAQCDNMDGFAELDNAAAALVGSVSNGLGQRLVDASQAAIRRLKGGGQQELVT